MEPPKCPKCKTPMRERSGKNGPFWGCPDFPKCRGTRDIENSEEYTPPPKKDPPPQKQKPLMIHKRLKELTDAVKELTRILSPLIKETSVYEPDIGPDDDVMF